MYKNILTFHKIKELDIQKIIIYNDIGIELKLFSCIYTKEHSYKFIFYTKKLISKIRIIANKIFSLYNIEINLQIYKYLVFLVKNVDYPAISLADSFWSCNDFLDFKF